MHTAIIILHVILCLFLILVVLLQTGRGGEMGAVFGGSSSTTFGGRGAGTFLSKTTSVTAVLFMVTSLGLAILSSRVDEKSVIGEEAVPLQTAPPETPPAFPGTTTGEVPSQAEPIKSAPAGAAKIPSAQGAENAQRTATAIPSTKTPVSSSEMTEPAPAPEAAKKEAASKSMIKAVAPKENRE